MGSPNIFDQMAAGQTGATPASAPAAAPSPKPAPSAGGNIFDQLAAGQLTEANGPTQATGPTRAGTQELTKVPPMHTGLPETVVDTMEGMGGVYGNVAGMVRGAVGTLEGMGRLAVSAAGGSGVVTDRHFKFLDRMKEINEGAYTQAGETGKVMEGLAEFASGDALLKELSYAERMQKVLPFLKTVEGDPALMNALRTGIVHGAEGAIAGGGVRAAQTGDAGEALEGAAGGLAGGAAFGAGSEMLPQLAQIAKIPREWWTGEAAQGEVQQELMEKMREIFKGVAADRNVTLPEDIPSIRDVTAHLADAVRTPAPVVPTSEEAAATTQNELQKGIRNVIRKGGQEASVTPEEPESIRDVALKLSDAMHDKAKGIYQQLDEALEGRRFQSFSDRIRNIDEKLRTMTGTNPDEEGRLVELRNAEYEGLKGAIAELRAKGVDPDLINEASTAFRQHKGAEELSNNIRKSTRGLRPELRQAGQEVTPETVHPEQFANRVNAMYDSGRLQDVLGQENAQDLLRHADRAQLATPKPPAALRQQSDALDKVTQAIRDSAGGMRPQEVTPGRQGATPESLKIQQLFGKLTDLHDDGVLEEALGPARARDLLNEVDRAKGRSEAVTRRVNRIKTWAKVGTIAGGFETLRRTAEHLLEGRYYNR